LNAVDRKYFPDSVKGSTSAQTTQPNTQINTEEKRNNTNTDYNNP